MQPAQSQSRLGVSQQSRFEKFGAFPGGAGHSGLCRQSQLHAGLPGLFKRFAIAFFDPQQLRSLFHHNGETQAEASATYRPEFPAANGPTSAASMATDPEVHDTARCREGPNSAYTTKPATAEYNPA
jgi:hypothetical protein